jgi:hypothetical protein
MSSSKRHFTAVVNSKEHGLYISASPSSAARKIVSKLCSANKSKKVEFCVREITNGSKKKTYGPYLGEMKKLVKPIELKGRVIRYAPVAHLKKKKTATKTGKKIGKKMRGGTITDGGELDYSDFLILDDLANYNSIAPCKLTRKQDRLQEPFIFFGKKIYRLINPSNSKIFASIMCYEYVAFNEGIFQKTAKFNQLSIKSQYNFENSIYQPEYIIKSENFTIENIPIDALIKLKEFIEKQRQELRDPSFCKTIYNAVNDELALRNRYNTNTHFCREINKIEDNEKKIRLIQPHKQDEYRQLLVSISIIEKRLSSNNSNQQHSGPNGSSFSASSKKEMEKRLAELLRQKHEIETQYSVSTN